MGRPVFDAKNTHSGGGKGFGKKWPARMSMRELPSVNLKFVSIYMILLQKGWAEDQ